MKNVKKLLLLISSICALSLPFAACNGLLTPIQSASQSESASDETSSQSDFSSVFSDGNNGSVSADESSSTEESVDTESSSDSSLDNDSSLDDSSLGGDTASTDSEYGDSASEDSSSDSSADETPELDTPEEIVDAAYLLGVREYLEGTYTLTGTVTNVERGKKLIVTIVVENRETKPIECYNLKGVGTDVITVGDVITVSGRLMNYDYTIEFDSGCTLLGYESTDKPVDGNDPYVNVSKTDFYASYTPATSNTDAYYRSLHGFMSGELTVPDQAPTIASYQPQQDGKFIRNSEMLFNESGDGYTVLDCYGNEAFTVYRDGAYITLEEVAAYVYAFGTHPRNYTPSKNTEPSESVFGEYLRVNHTAFSGNTQKYPYEPKLPNISGCGGTLRYYEMDIGTTGTDCDPSYTAALYNDGNAITRGAARVVYGKNDLNGNGKYEIGELHVFYTYNHYNDFQEYLNYEGGWGEIFGNITGGGTISSKYDYNPTPYVEILLQPLYAEPHTPTLTLFFYEKRKYGFAF